MTKQITKSRWEVRKWIILIGQIIMPILGIWIVIRRGWSSLQPARIFNVSIDLLGMLLLLILFVFCINDLEDISFRTRCFTYLVALDSMALFFDLICWCVDALPDMRTVNLLVNSCFYAAGIAVTMFYWHYLVELSEIDRKELKTGTIILNIGGLIALIVLVGNLYGRYYFDVDQSGRYYRTAGYFGSQIFMLIMLACSVFLIRKIDLSVRKKSALYSFISIPAAASMIQYCVYGISVTYIGVMLSLLIIYGYVFTEQNRELIRKRLEVAEKEREILLAEREQQRLETELSLASQIQMHVIPRVFPPFPDHQEFSLYAGMFPAKEVGGDFYDFFLTDPDHLALVIADVSGKGIPAALYMMVAKTMIKNAASQKYSPKEILELVNGQLCEDAEETQMFVTVWIGMIDIRTGRMTAANAGHEYPAICRKNGQFELYKDKHGFVLGGMDGVRYREYELELQPGDTLFVYTDGVTEAVDQELNLFGVQRMIEALNKNPKEDPETLMANVIDGIHCFTGDEEQFDDITMLALRWKGAEHRS